MLIVLTRALILYVILMFCLRLMGKRQLGELQPSELVVTILISNIASLPVEETNIPMILGIVPVIAFVSFELFLSNISLQSKRVRGLVSGKPVVIIANGVIDQKLLRKLRFSIDDLMEALRQNKVFDVQQVEYAIVETTGKVSILEKFSHQSVTPEIMGICGTDSMPPLIVISDGNIDYDALKKCHASESWLKKTVETNKKKVSDIFIMTLTSDKKYYIVDKER